MNNTSSNVFTNGNVFGIGIDFDRYSTYLGDYPRGHHNFAMSRRDLIEFYRCPARWRAGYESLDSKPKEFGALMDCKLLSKDRFADKYAVVPETYPAPNTHAKVKSGEMSPADPLPWNWNADACKLWKLEHAAGKLLVSHHDNDDADAAVSALLSDATINTLINSSTHQVMVTAQYHDASTGLSVPVKGLIDIVASQNTEFSLCLADYKTTSNAEMRAWGRQVERYGYNVQAAMYLDLWNAATFESRLDFVHIVQENYAPWHYEKRVLSSEFMAMGRSLYRFALDRYCNCLHRNIWPGYHAPLVLPGGFQVVEPEPWMLIAGETWPENKRN